MVKLEGMKIAIEEARKRLHLLVEAKRGNLVDPEVAAYSMELDELIVQYEREKKRQGS
ncbi:aspartyl-phosphate phosphatase Spo0E family protein [Azotosporobacter soli]|uniref:aspartyl-phosphate phosphatase Spo0E family protein n=1 Tax=Azotosporobacter soli TaxID=3055040 RepID=UPI0031FE4F92